MMTIAEFTSSIKEVSTALKPFAMKLTKDLDDANDLLQETLMKAYLNRDKFAEGTNLKAWLYTIMKNTFITNYQRQVRRKTFIDTTENLHYITTSVVSYNDATSNFAMQEITAAIEKLEDVYSVPFMMYYKGFKYHEIALRLNIPIGTVKNRIFIARKELKETLVQYAFVD